MFFDPDKLLIEKKAVAEVQPESGIMGRVALQQQQRKQAEEEWMRRAVFEYVFSQPEMAKLWDTATPELQSQLFAQFNSNFPLYKKKFEDAIFDNLTGFNEAAAKYKQTFGWPMPESRWWTKYGTSFAQERDTINKVLQGLVSYDLDNNATSENSALMNFVTASPENQRAMYTDDKTGYRTVLIRGMANRVADQIMADNKPDKADFEDTDFGGTTTLQDRALGVGKYLDIIKQLREKAAYGHPYANQIADVLADRVEKWNEANRNYSSYINELSRAGDTNATNQLNELDDVISGSYYNPDLPSGYEGHMVHRFPMFTKNITSTYENDIRPWLANPDASVIAPAVASASADFLYKKDADKSWWYNVTDALNPFSPGALIPNARQKLLEDRWAARGKNVPYTRSGYDIAMASRPGAGNMTPGLADPSVLNGPLANVDDDREQLIERFDRLYGGGTTGSNHAQVAKSGIGTGFNIASAMLLPGDIAGALQGARAAGKVLLPRLLGRRLSPEAIRTLLPDGVNIAGQIVSNPGLNAGWRQGMNAYKAAEGLTITPGAALRRYPFRSAYAAARYSNLREVPLSVFPAWDIQDIISTAGWNSPRFSPEGMLVDENGHLNDSGALAGFYPLAEGSNGGDPAYDKRGRAFYDLYASDYGAPRDNSSFSYSKPIVPQGRPYVQNTKPPGVTNNSFLP